MRPCLAYGSLVSIISLIIPFFAPFMASPDWGNFRFVAPAAVVVLGLQARWKSR